LIHPPSTIVRRSDRFEANMPLPSDEQLVKLSEEIVATFQTVFGKHPGFRPGPFDKNLAR
jgi:hypothetical protein